MSTELVIIFPLFLIIVFGVIQFGIAYVGKEALQAAAIDALVSKQTGQDASAVAVESMTVNASFVKNVAITISPTVRAGIVRAEVRGDVNGFLPGTVLHLSGSATGPIEAFRPQGDV